MPVDISKLIKNPQANSKRGFNPKYFHKDLTGTGGVPGLFNKQNNIVKDNIATNIDIQNKTINVVHGKHTRILTYTTEDSDLNYIENVQGYRLKTSNNYELSPLNTINQISNDPVLYAKVKSQPEFLEKMNLTQLSSNQAGDEFSFGVIASNIKYYKLVKGSNESDSVENFELNPAFVMQIKNPNNTETQISIVNDLQAYNNKRIKPSNVNETIIINNLDLYSLAVNPYGTQYSSLNAFLRIVKDQYHNSYNVDSIIDDLNNINFVDVLTKQAELNHQYLLPDIAKLFAFYNGTQNQFYTHRLILTHSYHLLKLEEKTLDDKDYTDWYKDIKNQTIDNPNLTGQAKYNAFLFSKLLSVNTRLSLTHELTKLDNNNNVHQFTPSKPFQSNNKYSPEQLKVITTTKPYSIVVAGAGSGKSHTLLGRLKYLTENDVDLSNVLVTSFTNTAAKNIIDRFKGGINSLTNANLFHKIYQNNFDHELTNDETIVNMLNILSDDSKLMKSNSTILETKQFLAGYMKKTVHQGFKRIDMQEITENLIALINDRLDDVLSILNAIHETSLLLEPIIINALMQNQVPIKYPDELSHLNFIITDESQDTSTFEYVLLLQLAERNNAQMMIIGDSNQTLYEFRNANPDFLNALERSQTFHTYTMSTNYRSQQSILTLTNEFLNVLKTNQNTKLQLHSNQFSNLDINEFKQSVKLANLIVQPKSNKSTNIKNEITDNILNRQDIVEWVVNQYKNKHQIAIMAFRNNDTQAIGDAVATIIKQRFNVEPTVGYTHKPQPRSNTWLSQMMSNTRDEKFKQIVQQGGATLQQLYDSLQARLQVIADNKYYNQGVINTWALMQAKATIKTPHIQAALNDLNHKKISFNKFEGHLAIELIRAENAKNNMARLIQNTDDQDEWQNADIVVSTIHSAKGLEFDSVICYFDETMKNATSQENLRLYGVALTRAKDEELIINRPKIKSQQGLAVPTNFAYEESDMFVTPMRTAYARVTQALTKKAKTQQP